MENNIDQLIPQKKVFEVQIAVTTFISEPNTNIKNKKTPQIFKFKVEAKNPEEVEQFVNGILKERIPNS